MLSRSVVAKWVIWAAPSLPPYWARGGSTEERVQVPCSVGETDQYGTRKLESPMMMMGGRQIGRYTWVSQPKSKPAILTPANLTPAATVRAAPKATIEPARSFEMENIVKKKTAASNECGSETERQQHYL